MLFVDVAKVMADDDVTIVYKLWHKPYKLNWNSS